MLETTLEHFSKQIIEKEKIELEYNIIIQDELNNTEINNLPPSDMNYICVPKRNLPLLLNRLKGDYFYNSNVNLFSKESVNEVTDYINSNWELVKENLLKLELNLSIFQVRN